MMLVGRLAGKVDERAMILLGLGLTALSLWEMAGFNTDVGAWALVRTGITQGLGLGFIFVPLSTITFTTLAPHYRNEGTAMFSLMRNIGSSIGISVVMTRLAQGTQVNHALLAESVTPFRPLLQFPEAWNPATTAGLVALNNEVSRQAATMAYLQDFRLMMVVVLAAIPLLLLLRGPRRGAAATPDAPLID
jgi:DHA2 family multidrug resistance protein